MRREALAHSGHRAQEGGLEVAALAGSSVQARPRPRPVAECLDLSGQDPESLPGDVGILAALSKDVSVPSCQHASLAWDAIGVCECDASGLGALALLSP